MSQVCPVARPGAGDSSHDHSTAELNEKGTDMAPRAAGYVDLTMRVYPEDDQYVSECIELGVASSGATIEEAFEAIADAAAVYLNALEQAGEIERVFAQRGLQIKHGKPEPSER